MEQSQEATKPSRPSDARITIAKAPIAATPIPGSTELIFPTEKERAQRAIEVFEEVAAKYGDPYQSESRYFIAVIGLSLDRPKAMSELVELRKQRRPK